MNGKRSHQLRVFTNGFAFFILVMVAGLVVAGRFITEASISALLNEIAKYSSMFLVALASLWYAISKRGVIPKIIWAICVIAIVCVSVL